MTTDPHENAPDEDPEQHIGEELPDPWAQEPEPDISLPGGAR